MKDSPAKALLSEKLNQIEKLHQPKTSIVCLSNTTKVKISLYKCVVYIYILLLRHYVSINKCWSLTESFSCLWVANTQTICSNKSPRPSEVLGRLCYPSSMDLPNTTWAQRELINQFPGTKATSIVSHYRLSWNSTSVSWFGCCFRVGSGKVFIFVIRSMYFRYLMKSLEFVSYSFRILIAYISKSNWGLVVACGFGCVLFLRRLRCIFPVMILRSENTSSIEVYASHFKALYISVIHYYRCPNNLIFNKAL